jgi:flagellin-specific chaperone FliS
MSYFMTNSSQVNCISQNRQIHMGTHIYHMCNILSNLTIMLDFLVITDIATFDFSHDEHI